MSAGSPPGAEKTAADFPVGARLTTRGRTVTEADLTAFAALTWDTYPVHTDEEFAKRDQFGERIASGPMTISYAVGLLCVSNWYETAIIAFLGAQQLQLQGPVRIGDTIRVDAEVLENRPTAKPHRAVVTVSYTVRNQRDDTVLTMNPAFLMRA